MLKRTITVVGLGCVMAVGCGEESIGPDPDVTSSSGNSMGGADAGGSFVSGSRLKARTLVGDDGARSPAGWYDSELEVECGFGTAADGSTRCLPKSQPFGYYFADPGCTSMLVATECGATAGPYVALPSEGCDAGPRFHRVGSAIAQTTVYVDGIGPCTEQEAPSGVQFFKVEGESQPSVFVGAEAEVDD